jgi:hypothetical protein
VNKRKHFKPILGIGGEPELLMRVLVLQEYLKSGRVLKGIL